MQGKPTPSSFEIENDQPTDITTSPRFVHTASSIVLPNTAVRSDMNYAETVEIQLESVMDPAPFMLLENMPVSSFYPLFTKVGIRAACVVTKGGEFCGLISRS